MMFNRPKKSIALIVAHPDDETLWAGGLLMCNPSWKVQVFCLCRGSDAERASKFYKTLVAFNAKGSMGDLDDGPEQTPLEDKLVEKTIIDLLPDEHFDTIITHNPSGEYTRHIRHEETGKAVIRLWQQGKISTKELWIFAYEDGNKKYFPRAVVNATIFRTLTKTVWTKKYRLIRDTYGFEKNSWEAETTPKAEAFWQFTNPEDAIRWNFL
jgi:LmbE family N-acetylglucosaminyl deacetylase